MGRENNASRAQRIQRAVLCETLEARRMLALAGIGDDLGEPLLIFDGIETTSYDATTNEFHIEASALSYFTAGPTEHEFDPYVALLEVNISVDNTGALNGGASTSTDVKLAVDLNFSGTIDGGDQMLLTGQCDSFAFDDAGNTEYTFLPTGGVWQGLFFTQKNIGLVLNLINAPSPLSFAQSFEFVTVKGPLGSLGGVQPPPAAIDIEKYIKGVEDSPGGEGLTPGYWKQEHHFDDWTNYSPFDNYNVVFGVVDPDNPTLLEALERGGGENKALGRHAVAAILNASHNDIDYAFTVAQIIAMVQQAHATGEYEETKNILAQENEKGAQLGDGPLIVTPTPGFGDDADDPPGPTFPIGSQVMFTYVVTNPEQTSLANVTVVDDNETPDTGDDFNPTPVLDGAYNVGDDDMDGLLDAGEQWLYTWTKIVTAGQHENIGSVTGTPVDDEMNPTGPNVTDEDPANWNAGIPINAINVEKYVKAGDGSGGGEGLTPGYWKQPHHFDDWVGYLPTDSFNAVFGVSDPESPTLLGALRRGGGAENALGRHAVAALLNVASSDINYAYTEAEVIAMVQQAYATGNFEQIKNLLAAENEKGDNGSSGGSDGSSTGFGIDADAPPGLNVPVGSQVTFTYIVTNPGDSQLDNVIVVDDNETPDPGDDYLPSPVLSGGFNVGDEDTDGYLDPGEVWLFTATKTVTAGQHKNIGTATGTPVDAVGTPIGAQVSDDDAAHWFGVLARIGDVIWEDQDGDARKDAEEPGVAGVTVKLLNGSGQVIATTTSDSQGRYKFESLGAGMYFVEFVKPNGFRFTSADVGDDVLDSDADASTGRTSAYSLTEGEDNASVSAGLVDALQGVSAPAQFWASSNGQTLLGMLNVGTTSKFGTGTALGHWLGRTFPAIWGAKGTSNYLLGKSTSYIANRVLQMYSANANSLELQALSLALSVYCTTTELNNQSLGQWYADYFGFTMSSQSSGDNLRNLSWNVGDNGEAFASGGTTLTSADNQSLSVWTLLEQANAFAYNGVLWANSQVIDGVTYTSATLRNQASDVLMAITSA